MKVMNVWKILGAGVLTLMIGLPAEAQVEDKYEKKGEVVTVTRYYDDGSVREVGTFKNDKPDGRWVEYNRSGDVKTEALYVNGEKDGKWFVWTDDGEYLYEVVYQENVLKNASRWKIEDKDAIANN
jgi:antitoxin component YwqK of YwqJK toxin-antitoxin module